MSAPRPASGLLVGALMRRVAAAGGFATVIARGDESAGGIVAICMEAGEITGIIERAYDIDDRPYWQPTALQVLENPALLNDWVTKRRRVDGDLWLIELDIAQAERFAAETGAAG